MVASVQSVADLFQYASDRDPIIPIKCTYPHSDDDDDNSGDNDDDDDGDDDDDTDTTLLDSRNLAWI